MNTRSARRGRARRRSPGRAVVMLAIVAAALAPSRAAAWIPPPDECYVLDPALTPFMYISPCYDTTVDWSVDPPYDGPAYESETEAAANDPPPASPVAVPLPTWRNLYDWPNGHGTVGWHSATSAVAGAYGIAATLGGNFGLWLWPAGDRDYVASDSAEWTYTAPGTTRISTVTLNFAYRNKLLAHHCIAVGLRAGTALVTQNEWCQPVKPPDSQRDVAVTLADPSSNPAAKTLFFRIRVDCKGATSCSKHIPSLDPLQTAGYARLKLVDMTLVDDDLPQVAASGPFRDLDGTYINGRGSYDLTVDADDAGSGTTRAWAERLAGAAIASNAAPCDPTHRTPALDARICPAAHSFTSTIDTPQFPEGTNRFVARAEDVARNAGSTAEWRIMVDRTAPGPASGFTLVQFDPVEGAGEIAWQPGTDPVLADGTPGSAVAAHEFRFNQNGTGWSEFVSSAQPGTSVEGATGDTVAVEVREVDAVGNVSGVAAATITLTPVDGPDPIDETAEDSEEAALVRDFDISAAEAQARIDRQPSIEAMDDYLAENAPDRYAGLWVDHRDGGKVKVGTTQQGITAGVPAQFGVPASLVEEVVVARTLGQLQAAADDVAARAALIGSAANRPTAEIDVIANRIRVNVPDPFDPDVQQLLGDVRALYGPSLRVVVDAAVAVAAACTRFQCPPPLRGGIEIANARTGGLCSAGFNVKNAEGTKFLLTAGHCGTGTWRHGRRVSRKIGSVVRRQFGGRIDSELIKIDNPGFWDPGNLVFHSPTIPAFPITSVARRATMGTYLCHSGRTTGTHCGPVISTWYNWENLRGLVIVRACADRGDSGGSIYSRRQHRAYGVLSIATVPCTHTRRDWFGFEPIRFTLAAFDVSVITQ